MFRLMGGNEVVSILNSVASFRLLSRSENEVNDDVHKSYM